MSLLAPLGLWAVLLSIPVLAVHMLRPRRPREVVSSLLLWGGERRPISASQPWQKPRWSLLLLLQLLAVVLFAVGLARPATKETAQLAPHTVFIIDASGSMASLDGSPDRLGAAAARAITLRDDLPAGGSASLVVASPRPAVLLESSVDRDAFAGAVQRIRVVGGAADFEGAFLLAESLASADRSTGYVLISDGGITDSEQRLAPPGTRYEALGEKSDNLALSDLSVSAAPVGISARVTIANNSSSDATRTVQFDVDGVTASTREVSISHGQVVEETFELPSGSRVSAFLVGTDLLAFDNQRYAAAPVAGTLKVRVSAEDSFFIDQLLSAIPDVDTDVAPDDAVDLEIYAGVPVPSNPETPFIAIDAPGGAPGVVAAGRAERPIPTFVADDPILADVDVSGVAIADAQTVTVTDGEVLLAAPGVPLIVRGDAAGVPFFYFTFSLGRSNLPVQVAFPIVGSRMVAELAAVQGTQASAIVGEDVPLGRLGGTAVDPRGQKQAVAAGERPPMADIAGFWTVSRADGTAAEVAVNVDTRESQLEPRAELAALRPAGEGSGKAFEAAEITTSLLPWVLGALLILLACELIASWREIGVGRRQWWAGIGVRAGLVSLVVLALLDPAFPRSSGDVTTVFVLDVSGSLGDAGVDEGRAWVLAALADKDGAQSGVVEVGREARVAQPIGSPGYGPSGDIDPNGTNLAAGLRLAQSMLTGDTRERAVLVSDGRSTEGDLVAEVERLAGLGLVLDVHTIQPAALPDAAVASIDAPNSVSVDESYELAVDIVSTVSANAVVKLFDENGKRLLDEVPVSLVPGSNPVSFAASAGATGIQRYQVAVRMEGDSVSPNDASFVAVDVLGPASVLVIEGVDGNGVRLAAALEAKGLEVDRLGVGAFPALQDLSEFRAVVLADVHASDLTDEQILALGSLVRELGRGLVVVGGDQSYALGEYGGTELEALLPVESEIEDIKQEVPVAEVLVIDTSQSMGTCHCRPVEGNDSGGVIRGPFGSSSEMVDGGPNKTDISRAAAARAILALNARDEVGVLAFNGLQEWVIPLQQLPSAEVIEKGLGSLQPSGETRIGPALREAAASLRESKQSLRHIILFTDGFSSELGLGKGGGPIGGGGPPKPAEPDALVDQADIGELPIQGGEASAESNGLVEVAAALAAEGITISVVATGEGAIPGLQQIAEAGGGRFYPGRDLSEIPEIFVKEARLAARTFINEGDYVPTVTSISPATAGLASAPALAGYVATSPRATADVQLVIGEFSDPLLASWRVGLGKVTSWTSDGGERWAADWAAWDGFDDFWSAVVRDTFPLSGSSGQRLRATVTGDLLQVKLESAEPWPAGTEPVARIGRPDGTSEELRLDRRSDFEFVTFTSARETGTYAVGVELQNSEGQATVISALASRTFSAEYLPGEADAELMRSISEATGGRGEIEASGAFDAAGLEPGRSEAHYRWWFLLAAALLWPLDVAVRRIRIAWPAQVAPES